MTTSQVKGGTVKIKGKKLKKIQEVYQQSLTSGIDMKAAVQCPKGENENAWVAFNGLFQISFKISNNKIFYYLIKWWSCSTR